MDDQARLQLAERIREACIAAALNGYEDAAMSGLCSEGALEVAISAMRRIDIPALLVGADKPAAAKPK